MRRYVQLYQSLFFWREVNYLSQHWHHSKAAAIHGSDKSWLDQPVSIIIKQFIHYINFYNDNEGHVLVCSAYMWMSSKCSTSIWVALNQLWGATPNFKGTTLGTNCQVFGNFTFVLYHPKLEPLNLGKAK